jgi:hypothetical protein
MELNNQDEIDFFFTREEANLIIEGLGSLPFKNVYKLIEKIHLQAKSENPITKEHKEN